MTRILIALLILAIAITLLQIKKANDNQKELESKKAEKDKKLLDKLADLKSQAEFNDIWLRDGLINEYSYNEHQKEINKELDEIEKEIENNESWVNKTRTIYNWISA